MKGSLAKAARTFDALRIKMEAGVSEPASNNAVAEVPAQDVTTEVASETPAAEAVVTEEVVAEVAAEATDAAETPAE
jgi:large subunit ribosomal protein L10